jgi:NAD(P)-dependent dehydrogenase (short-subunit alcohol dehydrogenase family)
MKLAGEVAVVTGAGRGIGRDRARALAARLSVEIGCGRFDKLAGRMLMAARGDLDLDEAAVNEIVSADLRSLRVNGMPPERRYARVAHPGS